VIDEDGVILWGNRVQLDKDDHVLSVAAATSSAALLLSRGGRTQIAVQRKLGSLEVQNTNVIGLPLASVSDDSVAWLERASDGSQALVLLVGEQEPRRVSLDERVTEGARLVELQGTQAYVSDMKSVSTDVVNLTSGEVTPLLITPSPEFDGMLVDVSSQEAFLFVGLGSSVVIDKSGEVIHRLPGQSFGSFSPDGRMLLVSGPGDVEVLDTAQWSIVEMNFPNGKADWYEWTSDSDITFRIAPFVSADDVLGSDDSLQQFSCSTLDARCRLIADVVAEKAQPFSGDARSQLLYRIGG